ncbi:MAG: preprotein translocase subunit YajC [Gammaproteobacteria bacterium]|nr:preprotein translocase subunit YajC [Gammaproteobacteria bacterium]
MNFFISDAMAQGAAPGGGAEAFNWIFLIGMVVVFYFFLIRPQMKRQKQHQEMVGGLSKGDEVVTQGGILGKIVDVGENFITVEIAEKTQIKVQKQMVGQVMPKGTLKSS